MASEAVSPAAHRVGAGWLTLPLASRVAQSLARLRFDLAILGLSSGQAPAGATDIYAYLLRAGGLGAAAGVVLVLALRIVGGTGGVPVEALPIGLLGAGLATLLAWRRIRARADSVRKSIERRLPRILTGARMLLESGAATPERALAVATTLYDDPAADLIREAMRYREVNRLPIEAGLDAVAELYGVHQLNRLADAFRVSGRYGTQLASTIATFAAELRREYHAGYRERMTRAPVLMTIPALVFFVAPLLVLVLYLVFAPLGTVLTQL